MAINLSAVGNKNTAAQWNNCPEAQVRLNASFTSTDAPTDEETINSLPVGISLDNMEAKPVSGTNEEWQMAQARNALLAMVLQASAQMESVEERIISDLQIQIRRWTANDAPDANVNPYMAALGNPSAVGRVKR